MPRTRLGPAVHVAIALLLILVLAAPAAAQYMYLDANGDSLNTADDQMHTTGETIVDIWLDTNHNRDGSLRTCPSGEPLTVNSYEFILHAEGGSVSWGSFTNHQEMMTTSLGNAMDSTDYHNGFGGGTILSPGRMRLATLSISIASGDPSISIVPTTPLSGVFLSAFGSQCPGQDSDNTLKLGLDWFDTGGARAPTAPLLITAPEAIVTEEGAAVSVQASVVGEGVASPGVISVSGQPESLTLEVQSTGADTSLAVLSGQLGESDAGTYTIIWSASTTGGVVTDTTIMEVASINFPPEVLVQGSVTIQEGQVLMVNVYAEDPDYGDEITSFTANLSGLPVGHGAAFTKNTSNTQGLLTWPPDFSDEGTYSVTFTASNFLSGSASLTIHVQNNDGPWSYRSVRLQLPSPGYRVNVQYFWCPTTGLCKEETLAAGDSGQVYVHVQVDPENGNYAYWDKIRVEFPARTSSAYFTVPESQEDLFSALGSDPQFIGHPVEWYPTVTLPPYNYNYVPTASSTAFVRMLAITDEIRRMWDEVYGVTVTPEEIRLWEDLDVASFYHSGLFGFNYIRWPWDLDRYYDMGATTEAYILAHEFTHVMQYRSIYSLGDFPSGAEDHTICSSGNAEQSWNEGMANGIAEYFLVRMRGERYGTNNNAGNGLGREQRTVFWRCDSYGTDVESTTSFYVYLMNSISPREFMDCLRFATYDRVGLGERHAQSLVDFHDIWNDRPPWGSSIVTHRAGSWNDEGAYLYVQGVVAAVESPSPPLDQFGGVRKVYPVPARDQVRVEALGPGIGAASLRIVQPSGRVVRRFEYTGLTPGQYHSLDIDVSGLPSGVYLLWYSDSTERGIRSGRKLVIAR